MGLQVCYKPKTISFNNGFQSGFPVYIKSFEIMWPYKFLFRNEVADFKAPSGHYGIIFPGGWRAKTFLRKNWVHEFYNDKNKALLQVSAAYKKEGADPGAIINPELNDALEKYPEAKIIEIDDKQVVFYHIFEKDFFLLVFTVVQKNLRIFITYSFKTGANTGDAVNKHYVESERILKGLYFNTNDY